MKGSTYAQEMWEGGERHRLRVGLLKVLRSRFGDETAAELTDAVNAVENLKRLDRLFDQALAGTGLNEFRSALAKAAKSKSRS